MYGPSLNFAVLGAVEIEIFKAGMVNLLASYCPSMGIFHPKAINPETVHIGHKNQESSPVGSLFFLRTGGVGAVAASVSDAVCRGIQGEFSKPVSAGAGICCAADYGVSDAEDCNVMVPHGIGNSNSDIIAPEHIVAATVRKLQGRIVDKDCDP